MASEAAQQRLSDAEYRMFRDFFRSVCGLWFGDDSRFLLESRLSRRMRQLDVESFAAYHYLLRKGAAGEDELASVIDELTTNETYFFRERNQLRALIDEIVPALLLQRAGPVNVWSAGCSSGEEPYSIVMMALEAGLRPGIDLRVQASDISRRVLAKAREAEYREASFRETPPDLRARYFKERSGLHVLSPDVRQHVSFTRLNLLEPARFSLLGPLDVVLCRNVIIYFDRETKARVIESFAGRLAPGGYLLLGHSESLIHVTSAFELAHLRSDLVYRRPQTGPPPVDPRHTAAFSALRRTTGAEGER
ncbi:MAG TPA: CheR family methyltransferase [Myxococcota bacterium]